MLDGEFTMTAEEFLKNLEEGPITSESNRTDDKK